MRTRTGGWVGRLELFMSSLVGVRVATGESSPHFRADDPLLGVVGRHRGLAAMSRRSLT